MIKLNIQRFGHTNSTSNYNLPQFVGTDKPQWLTDINQAFAGIDTAIHTVSVLANLNSDKIGDLTDLDTDNKIDLVSAINEVDSHTDSNTNTIAGHTTAISDNTQHIGDITDLDTVDKSNLVSAINEVDLLAKNNGTKIGNTSNLQTIDKTSLVGAINEVDYNVKNFNLSSFETIESFTGGGSGSITVAKNSNGSLAKIYGNVSYPGYPSTGTISFQTSLRPSSDITINGGALGKSVSSNGIQMIVPASFTLKTTGVVEFNYAWYNGQTSSGEIMFINSLIFVKDFGDTPIPVNNN